MPADKRLEFGWFLPTAGDTTAYGLANAQVAPSLELFDKVVAAAEAAGFEYMLVPVQTACWEAWISSAMMVARSKSIRMLVAARPSYINPVLLAKMISAFDQLSGGRICINLIAGQSEAENAVRGHQVGQGRALRDHGRGGDAPQEAVDAAPVTMTASSTSSRRRRSGRIRCRSLTRNSISAAAAGRPGRSRPSIPTFISSGATPTSASAPTWPRSARMAATHGRENDIGFGMRLQIVCRETEEEAWDFAHELVAHASEAQKAFVKERFATSEANRRVRELAATGDVIEKNLFTGITKVRPGAGIAVVGTPEQCADTLQNFIDLGCHSFCLSGYLHDEEAERFGKWVMPILRERNRERMLAA